MAKKKITASNNTDNIWSEDSNNFYPATTTSHRPILPPGVFQYKANPITGQWWLARKSQKFMFPYKIYGNHQHIIKRVQTAWDHIEGNLGILLNGLKGTGKTVTAQLLANWVIEDVKMPVLVVNGPVPLAEILGKVEQEILVIFDEFEKTHADKEAQQGLLTALDGMARNPYKRMFIFTTNNTYMEENLIDRPSRIRYKWEFDRLSEEVIEELMDDMLDPELSQYRPEIIRYLTSRNVCSIDSAKTTINEVNVFHEAPAEFEGALNLSETKTSGFTIDILDAEDKVINKFATYFTPYDCNGLRMWLSRSGARKFIAENIPLNRTIEYGDSVGLRCINLLQPDENNPTIWFANLAVPKNETWLEQYKQAAVHMPLESLWIDERPEDFKVPEWVLRAAKGESLYEDKEKGLKDISFAPYEWNGNVYNTETRSVFRIQILPKKFEQGSVGSGWMGHGPVSYKIVDAKSGAILDA